MKPNDSGPVKLSGSRRTNRIEQAAKQIRIERERADGGDEEFLKTLEGECYEYLTGGFVRASELPGNPEPTRHTPVAADGSDGL